MKNRRFMKMQPRRLFAVLLSAALLLQLFILPAAAQPQNAPETANSGFQTMFGSIARLGDYTYFIQEAKDHDFSVTGRPESTSIYRISDEADAEPERVVLRPSSVCYGYSYISLQNLIGWDGCLYFVESTTALDDNYMNYTDISLLKYDPAKEKLFMLDPVSMVWKSEDGTEESSSEEDNVSTGSNSITDIFQKKEDSVPAEGGNGEDAGEDEDGKVCEPVPTGNDVVWAESFYFDGGCYYFPYQELVYGEYSIVTEVYQRIYVYDLNEKRGYHLSLSCYENESTVYPLTVSHGMLFAVVSGESEADPTTIRVIDLEKDVLVSSIPAAIDEVIDSTFKYATDEYFYFEDETAGLSAYQISTGERIEVLTQDNGYMAYFNKPVFITDEEILMMTPYETVSCKPDGSDPTTLLTSDMWGMWVAPYVSGDWLFYCRQDDAGPCYARVRLDAEKLPDSMDTLIEWSEEPFEWKDNGAWTYELYSNGAVVTGYHGSASELTLPEELDGVPVRSLTGDLLDGSSYGGAKQMVIPEGFYSLGIVYAKGCEEVYLPSSLQVLLYRDFASTFCTDTETTFHYPGTLEDWLELCRRSYCYNDGTPGDYSNGTTIYKMEFLDGTYRYDPDTDTYEPWTDILDGDTFTITQAELESQIELIRTLFYNPTSEVHIVNLPKGYDGFPYEREYYLHNGVLIFAYMHDGEDQHRLYFKNEVLIRYIDENHVTYDFPNCGIFEDWSIRACSEAHEDPAVQPLYYEKWLGTWTASNGEKWEVISASSEGIEVVHHFLTESGKMGTFTYTMHFLNSAHTIASEDENVANLSGFVYKLEHKGNYLVQYSRYPDREFYKE